MLRKKPILALAFALAVASCGKGTLQQSAPDNTRIYSDAEIKFAVKDQPVTGEKREASGAAIGVGIVEVIHSIKATRAANGTPLLTFDRTACTGTLLDNDDVITAAHCIPKRIREGADCGNVVFRHSSEDGEFRCSSIQWVSKKYRMEDQEEKISYHNGPDIIVFHLASSPLTLTTSKLSTLPFAFVPASVTSSGRALKIWAYTPQLAPDPVPANPEAKPRVKNFLFTELGVCEQSDSAPEANFMHAVACRTVHGNSGAPLMNEQQEIQGIVSGFSNGGPDQTFITDASCLVKTANGYEWNCIEVDE